MIPRLPRCILYMDFTPVSYLPGDILVPAPWGHKSLTRPGCTHPRDTITMQETECFPPQIHSLRGRGAPTALDRAFETSLKVIFICNSLQLYPKLQTAGQIFVEIQLAEKVGDISL